ncbi:MAG: MBL fold metallo-hydrolase [Maribacter sp.]|nr:MBL fold metallo-hydrolase [Maribacter sp.]
MMKNKPLLFLLSLLHLTFVVAQDEEVTISIDTLSKDVYMLTGQGGNIGIFVGKDNVFMIDDQFDRLSEKIKSAITTLTDKPIAILFNTHMHGDHTGGNSKFNSNVTTLVAHDNVRKSLREQQSGNTDFDENMLPEITFSDDITFHDGEETIMAFHVHNAHTDGDAMVFFLENNVLHMGDTYFAARYPFIDLKSGGSVEGYINAHKKALLLINEDTKIIPGHGRPSNKEELQNYVAMLEAIKSKVQNAIAANASLEDVIKDTSLTEVYDEIHGNGFIKPEALRETFYVSLKGN